MGLLSYYLRVLFRSHSQPIRKRTAERGQMVSSIVYLLSAWTAFGFLIFHFNQARDQNPEASEEVFSTYDAVRKFGSDKTTVLHITGLNVEREVIDKDDPKLKITEVTA